MGLALDYTLNLWPLLGVYLDDGRIEIDQNLCLACLLEAVRDQTKCVDLKQVNRVLLQPHWRNDADFLPTALPS